MVVPQPKLKFFPLAALAAAMNCSKPTAQNRAVVKRWPSRRQSNRWEFSPPPALRRKIIKTGLIKPTWVDRRRLTVKFNQVIHDERQLYKLLIRTAAVLRHRSLGKDCRLAQATIETLRSFSLVPMKMSVRSLDRWRRIYEAHGIAGLVGQQRARSGRRKAEVPRG